MSNPYDPSVVSPTERELLIRIDERTRVLTEKVTQHLDDDVVIHTDHSKRLRALEAWRTGVVMLAGFLTVVAGTAAAFATNLF